MASFAVSWYVPGCPARSSPQPSISNRVYYLKTAPRSRPGNAQEAFMKLLFMFRSVFGKVALATAALGGFLLIATAAIGITADSSQLCF